MPPVAPAANGVASPAPVGMPPAAGGVPPVQAAIPPQAPPAATAVRWSAEMLQSLRLQAFEQLVAQLARQVQASPGAPAPQWPATGVSEALGRLLQALLAQVGTQQGQALQLLAAQPGSAALMQALAAGSLDAGSRPVASQAGAPSTPATPAGAAPQAPSSAVSPPPSSPAVPMAAAAATLAVAAAKGKVVDALLAGSGLAPQAGEGAGLSAGPAVRAGQALPALQTWWVQQGTLLTPQGERGFTLSLQVPQAWAQAQGAAIALAATEPGRMASASAMPPAGAAAPVPVPQVSEPGLRLPLDASLQSLASGPMAVVVQPRGADALRTSALLLLELQPLRQSGVSLAAPAGLTSLSPALAQEMQQLLQQRGDPWLHMAAAQASGALPRERREHQSHLCTTPGCQYEGRAPCAQPFCTEMNRLWGVARMERMR